MNVTLLKHIYIRICINIFPVLFSIIEKYSTFQTNFVIFFSVTFYAIIDDNRPHTENLRPDSGLPGWCQNLKMFLTALWTVVVQHSRRC
jgi:hypothetical protein